MTRITLITAHPSPTSFTAALASAYRASAERDGAIVTPFEVTSMRFDPVLRTGFSEPMTDEPDLARLRREMEIADHVAWFFPTWWVGLPASLKGLIDRLFLPDWAFRYEGKALPTGLMRGRSARWIATMDSPAIWYWLAHHDALGGSFGRGTLDYVGFGPVARNLVFSVRNLSAEARQRWIDRMGNLGRRDVLDIARRGRKSLPERAPATRSPSPSARGEESCTLDG